MVSGHLHKHLIDTERATRGTVMKILTAEDIASNRLMFKPKKLPGDHTESKFRTPAKHARLDSASDIEA